MEITFAQKEDLGRILELLLQVNKTHHEARPDLYDGPTTKYSYDELIHMLDDPDRPIFVAKEDDLVLGYLMAQSKYYERLRHKHPIKTFYIDDLCVDVNSRGMHVGQSLYAYAKNYAITRGFHNITLHVYGFNLDAINFYQKMGLQTQYLCLEEVIDEDKK